MCDSVITNKCHHATAAWSPGVPPWYVVVHMALWDKTQLKFRLSAEDRSPIYLSVAICRLRIPVRIAFRIPWNPQ